MDTLHRNLRTLTCTAIASVAFAWGCNGPSQDGPSGAGSNAHSEIADLRTSESMPFSDGQYRRLFQIRQSASPVTKRE